MLRGIRSQLPTNPRVYYTALYIAMIAYMVARFAALWIPEIGFAWLPQFGAHFDSRKSDVFKRAPHLVTSEYGYDGQFYAQLAIDPTLSDPETERAMDTPLYRARRILFSATAFVAGGGVPEYALQAYSIQNIVFWMLIALLLLHWFPPTSWQNAFRYFALLYTSGLVTSVLRALLDGPAMALILLAALLAERRRNTASALVLGLAGLGKETAIFAAAGLQLPDLRDWKSAIAWLLRMALVATPVVAWFLYLNHHLGSEHGGSAGTGNFDWPMFGWWKAVQQFYTRTSASGWLPYNYLSAFFLIALPVQILSILLRPHFENLWWRIGAVYALLTMVLGVAVWEGVTVAAARAVLPLTFAFNILHPRTLRALPLLLLGNAVVFVGLHDIRTARAPRTIVPAQLEHCHSESAPDLVCTKSPTDTYQTSTGPLGTFIRSGEDLRLSSSRDLSVIDEYCAAGR